MNIWNNKNKNLLKCIIFLISIILSYSQYLDNNNEFESIINNYYDILSSSKKIINMELDKFYSEKIDNNNSIIYYELNLINDFEEIFFDFQSEYGCLYIIFEKEIYTNSSYNYIFCSEGKNNIFSLNKNINKTSIIKDFIIGVGYSSLELNKNINFEFSLKVSIRKPEINIFEINSEHKILCKTEKVNQTNYRCNFMIINKNDEKENLIIYFVSKNSIKLNIFADYINKEEYDNWNINYLTNNIPSNNSSFNNENIENDFIIIPKIDINKYIYISVESNIETIIEVFNQFLDIQEEINLSDVNYMQFFSVYKSVNINLDLNDSLINEIVLSIVTLDGKASIYLGYDDSKKYITDKIENKLLLNINLELYKNKSNKCNLIINNLEKNDEKEMSYIFYIYYKHKSNNILSELTYGKSNKIFYNDIQFPIMLYEQIPNSNSSINANLQLYNVPLINSSVFDIEMIILSKKEIYQLKIGYDYDNIKKGKNITKGKFDFILSASYLNIESNFDELEEQYLIIYITRNTFNDNINELILGLTIHQINSLIYPSERIYHFGQLKNEEKVIYRLKGNNKYHLMRLEFGANSHYIKWSVKRKIDNYNYIKNDTDLSFVTEKWVNGRELLTMYIEKGEDIYLTIFSNDIIKNNKITNYIFKYVNSGKNSDFKNYRIKNDSLNYNKKNKNIYANKLNDIPSNYFQYYYLKIINKDDYIENEDINTIAMIESNNSLIVKGKIINNYVLFDLKSNNLEDNYYYINAYSIIINNYYEIEYISYEGLVIKPKLILIESKKGIILASLIISGIAFLIFLLNCIIYFYRKRKIRRISYDDILHGLDFGFNNDLDEDRGIINDDDFLMNLED